MDCPLLSAVSLALKGTPTPCMGPIKLGQPGGCPLFIESTGYEERRGPGVGGWCGLCVPDQHGKLAMFGPFALHPNAAPVQAEAPKAAPAVDPFAFAWVEGRRASDQGEGTTACPYSPREPAYAAWMEGWDSGAEAAVRAYHAQQKAAPLAPRPPAPAEEPRLRVTLSLTRDNTALFAGPVLTEGQEPPTAEQLAQEVARMVGKTSEREVALYGEATETRVDGVTVEWTVASRAAARMLLARIEKGVPRGRRLMFQLYREVEPSPAQMHRGETPAPVLLTMGTARELRDCASLSLA